MHMRAQNSQTFNLKLLVSNEVDEVSNEVDEVSNEVDEVSNEVDEVYWMLYDNKS